MYPPPLEQSPTSECSRAGWRVGEREEKRKGCGVRGREETCVLRASTGPVPLTQLLTPQLRRSCVVLLSRWAEAKAKAKGMAKARAKAS